MTPLNIDIPYLLKQLPALFVFIKMMAKFKITDGWSSPVFVFFG